MNTDARSAPEAPQPWVAATLGGYLALTGTQQLRAHDLGERQRALAAVRQPQRLALRQRLQGAEPLDRAAAAAALEALDLQAGAERRELAQRLSALLTPEQVSRLHALTLDPSRAALHRAAVCAGFIDDPARAPDDEGACAPPEAPVDLKGGQEQRM